MELWKPVPALGEHEEQADSLSREAGLACVLVNLAINYLKIRPQPLQSESDEAVEENLAVADLRREAISVVR